MRLTWSERQVLLIASRESVDAGGAPKLIEAAIEEVKKRNPEAFHGTADSLAERVFVHRPVRGEPCRSWLHSTCEKL